MRKDLREFFWKMDVADFERTKNLRNLARQLPNSEVAKRMAERYNNKMIELQNKWLPHKIGDM